MFNKLKLGCSLSTIIKVIFDLLWLITCQMAWLIFIFLCTYVTMYEWMHELRMCNPALGCQRSIDLYVCNPLTDSNGMIQKKTSEIWTCNRTFISTIIVTFLAQYYNSMQCTSTSMQLRRARQQGPTRTLTAKTCNKTVTGRHWPSPSQFVTSERNKNMPCISWCLPFHQFSLKDTHTHTHTAI